MAIFQVWKIKFTVGMKIIKLSTSNYPAIWYYYIEISREITNKNATRITLAYYIPALVAG